MSEPRKVYWDSSCFICFLNKTEKDRREICEDILANAQNGVLEIWTSTWTIVEVIRPKRHGSAPLPVWAQKAIAAIPESKVELEKLWERYQSSDPAVKLTPKQIGQIQGMFAWQFLRKINVDERIANKAVELARDFGLKPADSVHAASAILKKVDAIQRWDRDFNKVAHLIRVEDPEPISRQIALIENFHKPIGPTPEDFKPSEAHREGEKGHNEAIPAKALPESTGVQGSGIESTKDQAGSKGKA
jgi:predicted nucleic acid-binding protein